MIVVPVAVDRVRTLEDAIVDPEATVIVVITDLVRIREAEEVIAIILVPIRVRTREIVDLLVVLLLALTFRGDLDGAGDAHDRRSSADAGAAGDQYGHERVDAHPTADPVGDEHGDGHDERGKGQTLRAGGEKQFEIELEPKQDDAETEELVGDETSCVLHPCRTLRIILGVPGTNRELNHHADEQGDNERAEDLETLEPRGPHADECGRQCDDGNQRHLFRGNAFGPFSTEFFHGFHNTVAPCMRRVFHLFEQLPWKSY